MKLRKHAGKQQISAEKNESILFYDKRTKRYRKRDRNIPISFYNKRTMRYRKRDRNIPISFYSKRTKRYRKRDRNIPISFYSKRTKRYRKRDRNIPISFYNKRTKRYRKRKRNVPISFYNKRMELYLKREENAENKAKSTLYLQDVEEESVSWCDLNKASILDKAAAYALFAFFCISVLLGLTLNIMLYRERLGVSTEFEQRFINSIPETLRTILSKEEYRRPAL